MILLRGSGLGSKVSGVKQRVFAKTSFESIKNLSDSDFIGMRLDEYEPHTLIKSRCGEAPRTLVNNITSFISKCTIADGSLDYKNLSKKLKDSHILEYLGVSRSRFGTSLVDSCVYLAIPEYELCLTIKGGIRVFPFVCSNNVDVQLFLANKRFTTSINFYGWYFLNCTYLKIGNKKCRVRDFIDNHLRPLCWGANSSSLGLAIRESKNTLVLGFSDKFKTEVVFYRVTFDSIDNARQLNKDEWRRGISVTSQDATYSSIGYTEHVLSSDSQTIVITKCESIEMSEEDIEWAKEESGFIFETMIDVD